MMSATDPTTTHKAPSAITAGHVPKFQHSEFTGELQSRYSSGFSSGAESEPAEQEEMGWPPPLPLLELLENVSHPSQLSALRRWFAADARNFRGRQRLGGGMCQRVRGHATLRLLQLLVSSP